MEFVKGKPYFNKSEQKIKQYPYLDKDITCDVLIVGGGIDGAVLNYFLSREYDTMLVDSSRLGFGSTCIATALLEFQLDDYWFDLTKYLSEKDICKVYKMGKNCILELESLIQKLGNNCHFSKKSTLLYSDKQKDYGDIKKEYEFRIKNGFNCTFCDEDTNPFDFDVKAGIFDKEGGAEFNPYLFEKQMIENSTNQQKIFENTKIVSIEQKGEKVVCKTDFAQQIVANKVIVATGFNFDLIDDYAKDICTRALTFSIVTKPIDNLYLYDKALVQDSLENYHYLRVLPDNRIIYGGEDFDYNGKPINSDKANKIYQKLLEKLKTVFPKYANDIEIDYSFCGMFGNTKNNLGIIGKSKNSNILYFLSCGANGIINSICGTKIVQDILKNKKNTFEKMFSPLREL